MHATLQSRRPAAVLLALALAAAPATGRAQESPAANPSTLARVVVVGASMSAGFGLAHGLDQAFEASLGGEHGPVQAEASELFFLDPLRVGPSQIEAALAAEPTLVVAIDYLFWFGYGAGNVEGKPLASEDERLVLLERGLASLEELECPLVLGDFPDMSASVGKMIAPSQMPAAATLVKLSARVRAWAAAREHTIVLPLATLVKTLGSKDKTRIGRHEFPAGSRLLQGDDLHPTLEGLAAVAQLVGDELVRASLAREADFSFELPRVLERLRASPQRGLRLPGDR